MGSADPGRRAAALAALLGCLLTLGACARPRAPSLPQRASPTWQLVRVIEVAGRQGVATDGEHYYVSSSTALFTYSKTGELLKTNEAPFDKLAKEANHIGDISVHDGEIYAGIEFFLDGRGTNIQVAIYDAKTLEYRRSLDWDPASGQVEVSAVAVDPAHSSVWMTDWVNGSYVYRYDLVSGAYAGKLHLRPVPQWQQGIAVLGDHLYLTADDGDAERDEHDNLWRALAETQGSAAFVEHVKTFDDFRRVGEIEGLSFDPLSRELLVLANRGSRIILGMPKGFYPGYDREIREIYTYAHTPPSTEARPSVE